jgi:hypothetical protein
MPDADRLDQLPENGASQHTPIEMAAMNRFFDDAAAAKKPLPAGDGKLRVIMYAAIAFLILGNPWIGNLMSGLPYVGNPIVSFLVRALLFAIVLWAMLTFIKK